MLRLNKLYQDQLALLVLAHPFHFRIDPALRNHPELLLSSEFIRRSLRLDSIRRG